MLQARPPHLPNPRFQQNARPAKEVDSGKKHVRGALQLKRKHVGLTRWALDPGGHLRDTKNRELKRSEVFVPPLRDRPESWARDESYLSYLIFKRTGWPGKLALVLIPLLGLVAWLSKSEILAGAVMVLAFITFIALMTFAFVAEKKRRRSWH